MAGDTESVTEILERHLRRGPEFAQRANARAARRNKELREQRLFDKRRRAQDDKLGQTDNLLATAPEESDDPRDYVLNQDRVDGVRAQTTMRVLIAGYRRGEPSKDLPHQYLWFKTDDIRTPELRDGNPPADVDRPKHLKGLRLVLDYANAPEVLKKLCANTAVSINKQHAKNRHGKNPIRRALQDDQILARTLKDKLGTIRA